MEFAPFLIAYSQEKADVKFVNRKEFGSSSNVCLQIILMKLYVKFVHQIISLILKTYVLKKNQDA